MPQSTAISSNCLTQSETNLLPVFKGASLHPCTNETAHHLVARLHLPVALRCNTLCYYCEKRVLADDRYPIAPGITSLLLSPQQALVKAGQFLAHWGNDSVIGIAGPGEPLANLETLQAL